MVWLLPNVARADDTRLVVVVRGRAPTTTKRTTRVALDGALGWQVALDGGARRGAHALVQRTTFGVGAWGASLAVTLGAPLEWQAGNDVVLDVSRSGAIVGGERRL